ncbi:hypothetical protein EJ06DRAFT_555276 [Trichodelitschia bisporula]|uniref:Arrestin-like N-terminal domain-containing protein n=1 Tax=Trichodelitschia bisporula TaxID=703511 RepID=A0A6G1I0J1_9PEZI|nr:hypothetical protein EJ06DRAFT_555276 [Trichodelitschia bisporula]
MSMTPSTIAASRRSLIAPSLGSSVRSVAGFGRPDVFISLHGDADPARGPVPTFGTLDRIEGEATLSVRADTRFDRIEIAFVGTTATWLALSSMREEASLTFLRLTQPIPASTLPHPRILTPESPLAIPFTFVVPTHLLQHTCPHPAVSAAHTLLPPSLGDPSVAGSGHVLKDDLAPAMARIGYALTVRLLRESPRAGTPPIVLASATRKIRIVPSTPALPPALAGPAASDVRLSVEKALRRGLLGSRLGRLVMSAEPPAPFRVARPGGEREGGGEAPWTVLTLRLRFEPSRPDARPPSLGVLTARLRAATGASVVRQGSFPREGGDGFAGGGQPQVYAARVELAARQVGGVEWQRYEGAVPHYTAVVVVPVALPREKVWVPTFYSCLVSRTYVVSLKCEVGGVSVGVKVPVRVEVDGWDDGGVDLGEVEAEVEGVFAPRYVGWVAGPPGYSAFGGDGAGDGGGERWEREVRPVEVCG